MGADGPEWTMIEPIVALTAQWRTEAQVLRQRGQESLALMTESFASELEAALHQHDQATLTLREAAAESGYAEESLRRMVRDGTLPAERKAGKHGHIRVRRRDLPKKPQELSRAASISP